MASRTVKWGIGCGLGCLGLVVVIVVVTAIGSASLIRNTTRGFEEAVQGRQELRQRFGDPGDFVPAADGRVPADRIEAFLAVREATRPSREGIESFFRSIPLTREEAEALDEQPPLKKIGSIFGITRSAFGLGSDLGELFRTRNRGLIDVEMSLGEYTYLSVLVYDSWLGHGLGEGPEIEGAGEAAMLDTDLLQRVGDDLRRMMAAQLASVPEDAEDAEANEWRTALAAEVTRLESDEQALPWQHGLPAPLETSFEPFRPRLEAEFSRATNPFELGQAAKRGRFSFTVE